MLHVPHLRGGWNIRKNELLLTDICHSLLNSGQTINFVRCYPGSESLEIDFGIDYGDDHEAAVEDCCDPNSVKL